MKKRTLAIKRLSSVTLLKIMLITVLIPWVLIDTGIILYHIINGEFVVDYYIGIVPDEVAEHISIGKYILLLYPSVVFAGTLFTLMLWVPGALSLWLCLKRAQYTDCFNTRMAAKRYHVSPGRRLLHRRSWPRSLVFREIFAYAKN
jgi:hypothetical protein